MGKGEYGMMAKLQQDITQARDGEPGIDFQTGKKILDGGMGIFIGVRLKPKVHRRLRQIALDNDVRMADVVASAIVKSLPDVAG